MNTCTLGGKPVHDPESPDGSVNWFYSSTGAGRYGHGRFLLTAADAATVLSDAGTGTVDLVLKDHRGGAGMTLKVYPAATMPYTVTAGATPSAGMSLVTVYDRRYAQDTSVSHRYNVPKQGFPYDGADPEFDPGTLVALAEWPWADMLTSLELPALPVEPTWKPRAMVYDEWQRHAVADAVAAYLHVVVGWDESTGLLTFDTPGTMNGANAALYAAAKASNLYVGGGDGTRNAKRLPGVLKAIFKGVNADDPTDPFTHRAYTKTVTVGTGTRTQPYHVGTHVAVYSGGAWKETATLDAVAADLAARAYAFISVTPFSYEFAGIVPFAPDGAIREILWVSNGQGARTRILGGPRFDYAPSADAGLWGYGDPHTLSPVPLLQFPSDQLLVGLDGINSSIDAAGTRRVWGGGRQPVRFRVDSDGGYAGATYKVFLTQAAPAPYDPTVALAGAALGADGAEAVAVNTSELDTAAAGSHWITDSGLAQTYFTGVVIGATAGGLPVVQFNAAVFEPCTSPPPPP